MAYERGIMRQTFADEIINAGYDGLSPDTVIIKASESVLMEVRDMDLEDLVSVPIFDYCFIEIKGESSRAGIYVGKFLDLDDITATDVFFFQYFDDHWSFPKNEPRYKRGWIFNYVSKTMVVNFQEGKPQKMSYSIFDVPVPNNGLFFDGNVDEDYEKYTPLDIINQYMYGAFEAFYLLHQKHEIELVTPSRQVSRQVERKTGKKPSPYFEIKVDPTKTQKRYTSTGQSGRTRDAHIVRGHFATYTDEKPLFGRLTGTFFKPAHVRGLTEGDMPKAKNYRIVLPEKIETE